MWECIKNEEYQWASSLLLILSLLPMVFSVDSSSFSSSITHPYRKGCLRMSAAFILYLGFMRNISFSKSMAYGSIVL
jgi:hypothetical protein